MRVSRRVISKQKQQFDLGAALGDAGETTAGEIIMPADYKSLSKAAKTSKKKTTKETDQGKKGKQGGKTSKAMKKHPMKKPSSKKKKPKQRNKKKDDDDASDCANLVANENDPISKYLTWDGTDPSKQVMVKRVHSAVWHSTLQEQLKKGMPEADAKARASKDAVAAKARFLKAKNMA